MSNTIWDLKSIFNSYGWNEGFKFSLEIEGKSSLRVYVGGRKTPYVTKGCGYDMVSSVIAQMINDLIGEQPYDSSIYGNTRNYSSNTSAKGLLCGGTGFSSNRDSFESLGEGFKLFYVYEGRDYTVYEVKLNLKA